MAGGEYLRQLREKRLWTQQKAAEELGVSVATVNNWEHNRKTPRLSSIEKIAEVFDEDPQKLVEKLR